MRLLIAAADDAQMLSDARRRIRFDVDRESIRSLGRQLVGLDRTFVEQCIGNLLDNAVKYSYPNTRVDISGSVGRREFIIAVTNTGLPLKTDDLDHALQRNWRGDLARSATGEGSGLGLWIVDNLMRSMHAKVEIIPDEDQTTARLTIPLIGPHN